MGITGAPWYQMLGPQVNGYIPGFDETEALTYDPEKAKRAAGRRQGRRASGRDRVRHHLAARPVPDQTTRWCRPSRQNLEEVGFKFQLLNIEGSAWLKYLRAPFPPDQPATLQMISHDNTSGDASFSYPRYITCGGVVSATCNPKIDELVKQADVADGEERARLYQEASRIL